MNATVQGARMAIEMIATTAKCLAAAVKAEESLELDRCKVKSAAIQRIMQTENEETKKLHSASSAEKVVETDRDYHDYRGDQVLATCATIEARAALDAAKLTARLEVALAEVAAQSPGVFA